MKVSSHAERLTAANATAAFVVHDDADAVRRLLLRGMDCAFPLLRDPARTAYRLWGLRRASFAQVWLDPAVWRQYAHLLGEGERLHGMGADVRQLGGDFVVDRDGRIIYSRPQRRDDRPPVGLLLQAVEEP